MYVIYEVKYLEIGWDLKCELFWKFCYGLEILEFFWY